MYRTKLGLDKMDKWSKKYPKTYLYLAYLCIFIGIVGMVFVFPLMFWQLGFIIDNELSTGGGLVLPIQTENGLDSAVPVFYVPFWYWIIALFILATVHEFAHGVIAERFNIKIKSSGFAFFGIIAPILPAAFVEPDEKQLAKKPWWQQVAVMGAGSTSNFIFGILFFLVWIFAAGPLIDSTMQVGEISFNGVMNESSLKNYDLSSGVLVSFNGVDTPTEILEEIDNLSINKTYEIGILDDGIMTMYNITTFENPTFPNRGMIGINNVKIDFTNKAGFEFLGDFPLGFERLLFWVWFLNIAIGLMNLLPIWITDGGQIFRVMAVKYFGEKRGIKLNNFVSWISLILIIFTIWPSLLFSFIGIF